MTENALRKRLLRQEMMKAARNSDNPVIRAAVRRKPDRARKLIEKHVRQLDAAAAPVRAFVKAREDAPLVTLT